MSDFQVKNDSVSIIQVKFEDGQPLDVRPGHSRVTTDIGHYSVSKSGLEVFNGAFSGIANVEIISEETSVDLRFTVKNNNKKLEVVVTYGSHVDRIEPGGFADFQSPGKYTMSFPERNSKNSETLKALVTVEFPEDVDNATMIIV